MTIARTLAVAILGLNGQLVEVEANLTSQKPEITLIGLPDTALREAQQRIRSAVMNSGGEMPRRRLVLNLIPASLPKHGTAFDLAIAVATMVTTGLLSAERIANTVHLGELGLDGRLRPVAGILPAVRAAARHGIKRVIVPIANREEAEFVSGIEVIGAISLNEVLRLHGADIDPIEQEPVLHAPIRGRESKDHLELSDVVGNDSAVQATLVAAAGGHHLLLIGPPGSGKSMLAQRLRSLLPPLGDDEALEVSCIRSILGEEPIHGLDRRPPFVAPHHTATAVAMIGGGSSHIRPGAAVMANHGVFFLDEATEFSRVALDSLRQPLESGAVNIFRAKHQIDFPAQFQLVLAANPCPCGNYSVNGQECSCPVLVRRRYLARLSGPLLDRIDVRVHTYRVTTAQLNLHQDAPGMTTLEAQQRVLEARQRAAERLADSPWRMNAQVHGSWLRKKARLSPRVTSSLDRALEQGRITMRGYDRILRVSWTLADLAQHDSPQEEDIGRAMFFRQAIS